VVLSSPQPFNGEKREGNFNKKGNPNYQKGMPMGNERCRPGPLGRFLPAANAGTAMNKLGKGVKIILGSKAILYAVTIQKPQKEKKISERGLKGRDGGSNGRRADND